MKFNNSLFSLLLILLPFFGESQIKNGLNAQFKAHKIITLDTKTMVSDMKSNDAYPYVLKLEKYEITLTPTGLLAHNYATINSEGYAVAKSEIKTIPYRGYTAKGGKVSLTIGDDFLYGFIEESNHTYFIEPAYWYDQASKSGEFVMYEKQDVKDTAPKTCGTDEIEEQYEKMKFKKGGTTKMVGECFEIEYAICNDYSMVVAKGGVTQAENFAIGVTNNVNNLYDDEFADEVFFSITGQFTSSCPTCDPWSTTTDAEALLSNFRVWATGNLDIPHDVASLWTNRDFDGTTVGIAYVGAMCGSFRYNCLQNFSSNATSLQVMVTHELGHNLDAEHDSSSGFIMSPQVSSTSTWSSLSKTVIETYYNNAPCFSECSGGGNNGGPVEINFAEASSSAIEYANSGSTGECALPFTLQTINVSLSGAPESNVEINISIDNSTSTADNTYDFELLTPSLIFTPTGGTTKQVQVRLLDDKIDEVNEILGLELSLVSGPAILGSTISHSMMIVDGQDIVSSTCCSGGGEITYSNNNYLAYTTFSGNAHDLKSRVLYLASELTAAGLNEGFIDQLSLRIAQKNSTGMFENFRIGISTVANTTLENMSWISTTEVFNNDISTILSWNDFTFDTPFYWDGTSNIYMQFCFNNSATVGADVSYLTLPTNALGNMYQFQQANNSDGCSTGDIGGTISFTTPVQPQIKFRQAGGAIVESTAGQSAKSYVQAGETANFYSGQGKIIASVINTGTSPISCATASVETSGNSKMTAPFGNGDYTQKTFEIDADPSSNYELILYYTETELSTWGGNNTNLNIVQASMPISQSTSGEVEITEPLSVLSDVGGLIQYGYRANFSGAGYYALTDVIPEAEEYMVSKMENVDLVIEQFGRGLILRNANNANYRIRVNSTTGLPYTQAASTSSVMAELLQGNISFSQGKGIIIRRNSGTGYTRIYVNSAGNIAYTNLSSLPINRVLLQAGDFAINEPSQGAILKNSNGDCFRLKVQTNGTLEAVSLTSCPE